MPITTEEPTLTKRRPEPYCPSLGHDFPVPGDNVGLFPNDDVNNSLTDKIDSLIKSYDTEKQDIDATDRKVASLLVEEIQRRAEIGSNTVFEFIKEIVPSRIPECGPQASVELNKTEFFTFNEYSDEEIRKLSREEHRSLEHLCVLGRRERLVLNLRIIPKSSVPIKLIPNEIARLEKQERPIIEYLPNPFFSSYSPCSRKKGRRAKEVRILIDPIKLEELIADSPFALSYSDVSGDHITFGLDPKRYSGSIIWSQPQRKRN